MSENTSSKKTFAERAATEPTELQKRFADWIKEQTGVDVDLKSVQLACALRMDFQKSEENQDALKARKDAAAKAATDKLVAKRAKLEAELAKLNGTAATATEPAKVAEPVVDAAETPAGAAPDGLGDDKSEPAEPKAPAQRKPRVRRTATAK